MIRIPPSALRAEDDCPTIRLQAVVFKENAKMKSFMVRYTNSFSLLVILVLLQKLNLLVFLSSASEITVILDESSHNTTSIIVPTSTNPTSMAHTTINIIVPVSYSTSVTGQNGDKPS